MLLALATTGPHWRQWGLFAPGFVTGQTETAAPSQRYFQHPWAAGLGIVRGPFELGENRSQARSGHS